MTILSPRAPTGLHPDARVRPESRPRRFDELSERQNQVLRLVALGYTEREIGQKLGLARHTVKNHLSDIRAKLGRLNRVELALLAWGIRVVKGEADAEGNL